MTPATARPVLAILVVLGAVGACTGPSGNPSPTPAPAAGSAPSFELALGGAVALPAYASDAGASLNECSPADSGGWTYLYAGGTPFLTVDLSVYSAAASGADPSDFDLDIVAPGAQAVRVVPSGRREGSQGDGSVRIESAADGGVRIALEGEAVTLSGGPASVGSTTVHLDLRCPAED